MEERQRLQEELRVQQESLRQGETQQEQDPTDCKDAQELSEEQRRIMLDQCAQEYGLITPAPTETTAASSASAAKKGLTSSASDDVQGTTGPELQRP